MARGVLWIVLRVLPQLATTLAGLASVPLTSFKLGLARGAHRVTGDGCSRARHCVGAHAAITCVSAACVCARTHGAMVRRAAGRVGRLTGTVSVPAGAPPVAWRSRVIGPSARMTSHVHVHGQCMRGVAAHVAPTPSGLMGARSPLAECCVGRGARVRSRGYA
jgi:hypothetical protein